jgi:hypothetical protein
MTYIEPIRSPSFTENTDELKRVQDLLKTGVSHQQIRQCCAQCRAILKAILTQHEERKKRYG